MNIHARGRLVRSVRASQEFGHVAAAISLVGERDILHGADLALAEELVPDEIDEAVSGE